MVLQVLRTTHFALGMGTFFLWSYVVASRDHVLGCSEAPSFIYNKTLHLTTLALYMAAHATMLHRVQQINQPTEFALSKMGNVLLSLRRMKLFLTVRATIVTLWLVLVFYENAEETYLPVIVLAIHLVLVLATAFHIVTSVSRDNANLSAHERMLLGNTFYASLAIEITVCALWLTFNIVDVLQCHNYYGGIYGL